MEKKTINTLLFTCIIIIKLSYYMFPKTITYWKSYDGEIKWMYFLIEDDDLLEKHTTIWKRIWAFLQFFKTKIISHGEEVFYDKKVTKMDSNHTCLTVISLDSAFKKDENYFPQVFLKRLNTFRKKLIDILMIIWVIFLLFMSLIIVMKNRLKMIVQEPATEVFTLF